MPSITNETVTLTFTPTTSTVYWVWNLANASDSTNCTISIDVTNFSARHAGGGSISYTAAAGAAEAYLYRSPVPVNTAVDFSFNISLDELNAFASTMPVAGQDFVMTFTPDEGYDLPTQILVVIDGTPYLIPSAGLEISIDSEGRICHILVVPGALLQGGSTLYIEAIAIPKAIQNMG